MTHIYKGEREPIHWHRPLRSTMTVLARLLVQNDRSLTIPGAINLGAHAHI